jgi:NTP pyrophosphatase (non-canonical NTP hydrolase)
MTKELFEEITAWQKQTFKKATALSAAKHLQEETEELVSDLEDSALRGDTLNEYADCFMLLFGSARLFGLSYEQICEAINRKFEVNKVRKWGEVNEQGYVKHVEP